jgi:hypothetical protein
MNDRLRLITYQGKKILVGDFTRATPQEILALLDEARELIAKIPNGSLLTMADFTEAQVDKTVVTRLKEVLALDRPHVKRSAWVGTEKLPKVFYDNIKSFSQREFPTFKTREAAMNWLVSDSA